MKYKIVISGEGGQGIQSIAKIIAKTAVENGLWSNYLPSFGVEQRGTPSVAYLIISDEDFRYEHIDTCDIAIILRTRAIKSIKNHISPNTNVIFDSSTIAKSDLPKTAVKLFGIPATKFAIEKFDPRSFNVIITGFLAKQIDLDKDATWDSVMDTLGRKFKTKEIIEDNKAAFLFGYDLVPEKDNFTKATLKPNHQNVIFLNDEKKGEVVPSRCKGCGICLLKCPVGALSWSDELGIYGNPIPKIDLEKCIACGNCRNFCPDSAINVLKIPTKSRLPKKEPEKEIVQN